MYTMMLQVQVMICGSQTCEYTTPIVAVSQVCDRLSLSLSTHTLVLHHTLSNKTPTLPHLPVPLLHQTLATPRCISTHTTLSLIPAPIPVTVAVSRPTHRPNPHRMSDAMSSHHTKAMLQLQSGTLPCAESPTHPPDPPRSCLT